MLSYQSVLFHLLSGEEIRVIHAVRGHAFYFAGAEGVINAEKTHADA